MTPKSQAGEPQNAPGRMHIGELAVRTGLSHRTIRHYDEIGLLRPSARSDGGFRLYTEEDEARLLLIRRMKPLGYTLEQMAELLHVVDALNVTLPSEDRGTYRAALMEYIADARRRREQLVKQLGMADEFLALLQLQTSNNSDALT